MDFDYFSENYREFEKIFTELYIGDLPLTYITDDLLKAMSVKKPYFQLPPHQSTDSQKKWFFFEVKGDKYVFKGVFNSKDGYV